MSDYIWETFDSVFKTVHMQGRRIAELEARIVELERMVSQHHGEKAHAPREAGADADDENNA